MLEPSIRLGPFGSDFWLTMTNHLMLFQPFVQMSCSVYPEVDATSSASDGAVTFVGGDMLECLSDIECKGALKSTVVLPTEKW